MTQQQITFINNTLPAAVRAGALYGVNVIGLMAQSALETGWGASAPGNMYFGMKATPSWTGKIQLLWTTEEVNGEKVRVQAKFRAYDSPEDSFLDYAKLISSLSRYAPAMQYPGYNQTSQYIRAVAAGGYATAKDYANSVISVANTIKKVVSEDQTIASGGGDYVNPISKKKTQCPG